MADEKVINDSHCNESCALEQHEDPAKGQIVHRFVNNFYVHQGGDSVKCGNCGAEKSCPRCNATAGKHHCETCGIWISGHRSAIAEHARVHSGERPQLCDRCGMAFKQTGHLVQHERIHNGARPFVCDVCCESFTQQASLDNHKQSIHSSDRNHTCQQCSKTFKLRKSLMSHLRNVHQCTYDCGECGEKLRTRNEFTNHSTKHFKEKAELENAKSGDFDEEDDGGVGSTRNLNGK